MDSKFFITVFILLFSCEVCAENNLVGAPLQHSLMTGPLGFGERDFREEMETDRPDFTEGTQAIQKGHFQLESGYTYIEDIEDAHTLPELLLRSGVFENIELRVNWAGYTFQENLNGVNDVGIGFKQHLLNQNGLAPHFSYILECGLPTGSDNQTADELEPGAKLIWAYDITERTGIAGNINFASRSGESERFFETAASVTAATSITDSTGSYIEYFGIYPYGGARGEVDEHYVNGGFTYAVNPDTQLDIRFGLGLNSDAANMFSGIGFSWRI